MIARRLYLKAAPKPAMHALTMGAPPLRRRCAITDRSERQSRLAAVDTAAQAAGYDLLIVLGRGVISHFGHLLFASGYCPVIRMGALVVRPGFSATLAVTSDSDRALATGVAVTDDIRVLELVGDPSSSDSLGGMAALAMAGIATPRIGIAGLEDVASLPMIDALRTAIPGAMIESATDMMLRVKAVKSLADLAGMRASAALADDALRALAEALYDPACTLAAAAGAAQAVLAAGGAQEMLVYASKGPHYLHRPRPERLEAGELLTVFVEVANADGYWVELARLITRGAPSTQARRAITDGQAVMLAAREALTPGRTGGQAYAGIAALVTQGGYSSGLWLGHGVGVDHDLPTIGKGDATPLMPGMTIAFHPHLVDPASGTGSSYGDTFLVTEGAAEPLSRWPLDLIEV